VLSEKLCSFHSAIEQDFGLNYELLMSWINQDDQSLGIQD